jgi:hypothetical protein
MIGRPTVVRANEASSILAVDEVAEASSKIMGVLLHAYESTDWSLVERLMAEHPDAAGNANIMVVPISLGNAYLSRFDERHDIADFERGLAWLEWVAGRHDWWGRRWLTPAVAQYLAISTLRFATTHGSEDFQSRIFSVWDRCLAILEQEADLRLGADLPYRNSLGVGGDDPYDSSLTGDTKGEENAWEAVVLAAAANLLPLHPHAVDWDRKARQLAYDAITTPSDPPDAFGIKTTTVPEDFDLANHKRFPNPYYMAATIFLLCQGALSYRLAGQSVPPEFSHNVGPLFSRYLTYVDEDLNWTIESHPAGDASLFPFAFDPTFELEVIRKKSEIGHLWEATAPVAVLHDGDELWRAIQNGKVVLYHLMGSSLWHVPALLPQLVREPVSWPDECEGPEARRPSQVRRK